MEVEKKTDSFTRTLTSTKSRFVFLAKVRFAFIEAFTLHALTNCQIPEATENNINKCPYTDCKSVPTPNFKRAYHVYEAHFKLGLFVCPHCDEQFMHGKYIISHCKSVHGIAIEGTTTRDNVLENLFEQYQDLGKVPEQCFVDDKCL